MTEIEVERSFSPPEFFQPDFHNTGHRNIGQENDRIPDAAPPRFQKSNKMPEENASDNITVFLHLPCI